MQHGALKVFLNGCSMVWKRTTKTGLDDVPIQLSVLTKTRQEIMISYLAANRYNVLFSGFTINRESQCKQSWKRNLNFEGELCWSPHETITPLKNWIKYALCWQRKKQQQIKKANKAFATAVFLWRGETNAIGSDVCLSPVELNGASCYILCAAIFYFITLSAFHLCFISIRHVRGKVSQTTLRVFDELCHHSEQQH